MLLDSNSTQADDEPGDETPIYSELEQDEWADLFDPIPYVLTEDDLASADTLLEEAINIIRMMTVCSGSEHLNGFVYGQALAFLSQFEDVY